ncbi:hypothetical protein J5N97_000928 [Dioscorea zingiberensis]|uniref:5'-3' DNA helicase ZGRF1-like N-terminal domain-containing protein n=1 Tax=Dioscorea zingiberensis TaxID=325984 RepID=A0A9D5H2Q1_9LILI|nr:hypothetical protein J5N97_000928 [Dioscorea zingiberensis]
MTRNKKIARRLRGGHALAVQKHIMEVGSQSNSKKSVENKKIIMGEDEYKIYLKSHPNEELFINRPIEDYDLLKLVCDNDHATGHFARNTITSLSPEDGDTNDSRDNFNVGSAPADIGIDTLPLTSPSTIPTSSSQTHNSQDTRIKKKGKKRVHGGDFEIIQNVASKLDGVAIAIEDHNPVNIATKLSKACMKLTELGYSTRDVAKKARDVCLDGRPELPSDVNCCANMSIVKKWSVTYTKHLKQKRMVYQDGVLELCGSGRKVLLYDDCEKLIDSKFLKNDEVIECGQTVTLESHLVDIGVLEESQIPLADIKVTNVRSTERNTAGHQKESKKRMFHHRLPQNHSSATKKNTGVTQKVQHESFERPRRLPNATNTTIKEWNALYTTQITQKAKKFHDGILRLSICGSYMDQVALLNEEGTVLSSKYVKSAEFIETGKTYELPNYLVEICELRTIEGDLKKGTSEKVANSGCSKIANFTSARAVLNNKQSGLLKGPSNQAACSSNSSFGMLKNRTNRPALDADNKKVPFPHKVPSSSSSENLPECPPREVTDSNTSSHDKVTGRSVLNNKSLRDACQILTTLRKPVLEEKNVLEKQPTELAQSAQPSKVATINLQMGRAHSTSNFNESNVQNKIIIQEGNFQEKRYLNEPADNNLKKDSCELGAVDDIQSDSSGKSSLNSSSSEDVPISGITSTMETNYQEKSSLHNSHSSVHLLSGAITPNASANELYMECSKKLCDGTMDSTAIYGKPNTNTCSPPTMNHTTASDISFTGEGLIWQLPNETVPIAKSAISTLEKQSNIANIEISTSSGMKGDVLHCVDKEKNDRFAQTPATSIEEEERSDRASVASRPACAAIDNNNNNKYKDSEFQPLSTKFHVPEDLPTFDLGF